MADTRPRVTAGKPVNLAQLTAELGGVGLAYNPQTGEVVAAEGATVTVAQLQAAVDAHTAQPAVEDSARQRLRDLKAKGWANLTAAEKTEVTQRVLEAIG